jgi:hypothetical protein
VTYLQSTTEFDRLHVSNNHNPEIIRLDQFVKYSALRDIM